jgi:hypothetical protein
MNNFDPVLVRWVDITTQSGWITQDEADDFVSNNEGDIVQQVGFLYEQDDNQIVLLNSFFSEKDLLGDLTKIPKGAILQIIKLKY